MIHRDKYTSAANSTLSRLREVLILVNSFLAVCVEASLGRQLPCMYVGLISHGKKQRKLIRPFFFFPAGKHTIV